MRNILILSAGVGAGHIRAGEALQRAFGRFAGAAVEHVDVLSITGASFRIGYAGGYSMLVKHSPRLWGFLYQQTDFGVRSLPTWVHLLRRTQAAAVRRICRLIVERRPDVVVSTHFLPPEAAARLRRQGKWSGLSVVVPTDFPMHYVWALDPRAVYCVPCSRAAAELCRMGVACENIVTTGIPIHPAFAESMNRAELRRNHDLPLDRAVVLVMSGGLGVGPTAEVVRRVVAIDEQVQIVAVAGTNGSLQKTLLRLAECNGPPKLDH